MKLNDFNFYLHYHIKDVSINFLKKTQIIVLPIWMEKTYLIYMLTQTLEQMDGKSEQNCMKPENTHTHTTALLCIFCQGEIIQSYDLSGSNVKTFLIKVPSC